MKKIFIVLIILVALSIATLLAVIALTVTPVGSLLPSPERVVSGTILDCNTNTPLLGAQVTTARHSWGTSEAGYLVWDKRTVSTTTTDTSGKFALHYKDIGKDFKLTISKEDYFDAEHFGRINGPITIKLLQENETDRGPTYNCIPINECLTSTMQNGVQVSRNTCNTP